jgi:hypothetical protein
MGAVLLHLIHAVGACLLAGPAADASFFVMHRYAILGFEHRFRFHRAGLYAGCFTAVIAENRQGAIFSVWELSTGLVNEVSPVESLAVASQCRIVLGLTGESTGTAANTFS